ncbi:MAG: M1 family metallopeptidase [Actinomycetia bacterium]|nr:M1 family metallopeptidase [Actinomycetes bacterium]
MKRVTALGLLLVAAASCSSGSSDSTPTSVATIATTLAPTSTVPFTPGAPGVGDVYYPGLGNGGYDVQHYGLELTYDADGSVEADAAITAVATQNLSGFNLDFVGWEIDELTVDGSEVTFLRDGDELVITHRIPSGEHFKIELSYGGTPQPMQSAAIPIAIGWLAGPEGEQFVVAEPDAAHSWFPSNDHPTDKATFTFSITVPAGFMGAANGELTDVISSETTTTYHWSMDAPMAPYLATVVIGDGWELVEDPGSTETAGLQIRNMLPADLVGDAPVALAQTGEMINVLEEAFGPYPFDQYGIAVVDGFQHALENQTLSLFGRTMVEAPFFEYVHVHELAHQWFGNSVSVAQWSDIWLNEGFATFAELLWIEHLFGAEAYREEVANRTEVTRIAEYGPPATPPPNDLFNGSVYQRGALVLVALREEIGDDAFFATLRTYAERYADGNATTDNFIAVAEETSGHDLTDLFATWLYGQELPR